MYIEIVVKSKPVDAKPPPQEVTPQTVVNIFNQSSVKRSQSKVEPITPEDHAFVEEFKIRENGFREQILALMKEKEEATNHNLEIQAEWQKILMQGSNLEKVERKHAELEFSLREKEGDICQNFSQVQNKLMEDHCIEVLDI